MKAASARSRRASAPNRTTKRAPDSLAARPKSMPSAAPISSCSRGAKSNRGGSPQRRSSRLALSSAPSGTSSARRLGISASSRVELRGALAQQLLVGLDPALERGDLADQRIGGAGLATRPADLLGKRVAPGLTFLQLGLQRPERGIPARAAPPPAAAARAAPAPGRGRPGPHAAISGRARQVTRRDCNGLQRNDRNPFRYCARARCSPRHLPPPRPPRPRHAAARQIAPPGLRSRKGSESGSRG